MTAWTLDSAAERLSAGLRDPASLLVIAVSLAVMGATIAAVGWFVQPARFARGFAPRQPIPFSHRLHAASLSVPCLRCHSGARRSRHAGVPAAQTCMACHQVTKVDSPYIASIRAFFVENRTVPWKRVHLLPDHVFFDHRPHVLSGIACSSCHGPVEDEDVIRQAMSLRMGACLSCHRSPRALPAGSAVRNGPQNCYACHR